jgi:voltage-gated potassium channel
VDKATLYRELSCRGNLVAARRSYNDFIARHEVLWEIGMAFLAIAFVIVGFAGDEATGSARTALEVVDLALTIVFIAEFTTRIAASFDRRAYVRAHAIDLVALVPTIRGVRILRLLRLLRLIRSFAGAYRGLQHFERMARHRGLAWLFVTWAAVMVICSLFLYGAENGINKAISSPLDALWWGIVTLTTVGYGDVYPVTGEGRIAASVLMLLGIGLFSAITATLTSFMLTSGSAEHEDDRLRRLAALHRDGLLTDGEFEAKRTEVVEAL